MSFARNGTGKASSIAPRAAYNRSNTRKRSHAVACACEPLERRRLFATVSWITNGDGLWTTGSNWSTGSVPAPGDNVVLDVPNKNATITYNGGAALQLNNLVNQELLVIANANGATWTSGTWDGSGVVQIGGFDAGTYHPSKLAISGAADKIMRDGLSIVNNFGSTSTLSGTGNIVGQVGASIVNEATATFNVQSDADITFPSGVGDGIFENGGTFIKSVGSNAAGAATVIGGAQGFRFENSINFSDPRDSTPGDCQVLQGTLTLGDNQNVAITRGGTFEISAGATLDYIRGQHYITVLRPRGGLPEVIPSITGQGTLRVDGGSLQSFGTLAVHRIDVSAGQLLLQQNMQELAGTPQNNSTPVTVFGRADIFNFSGGIFGGNGGGIFPAPSPIGHEEEPGLVVGINSLGTPPILAGPTSFNWTGGTLSGAGRLVIDPAIDSSTISTAAPKAIIGGYGLDIMAQTTWSGSGTITMNGNSAIYIHASGTLQDQSNGTIVQGTVDANGGNIWNVGIILKSGGIGTTTFGVGINLINDVNPLNWVTAEIPILQYPDTFNALLAKIDIRTGTLSLQGTSLNRNDILIATGATLSYDAGTHLNQTYLGSNDVINATILGLTGSINFGAAIFNSDLNALVDVQNATFGTGSYTFDNTAPGGQVILTGVFNGAGSGIIGGAGTLEVQTSFTWNSGTFSGNNAGSSSLLIDNAATLTIPSGDRSTTNFYSIENRGIIRWVTSPGVLSVGGNYVQTSTGVFNSNIVAVGGAGALDHLAVTGNVSLDGVLNLTLGAVTLTNGEVFTLIDNQGPNPIVGTFVGIPQGDTLFIGPNAFIVSYTGGDGNDLVLTATVFPVITIADPPPVTEGNPGGTTNIVFTVTLSAPVGLDVSVNYTTAGGTATSGVDFVPTSGTLTIPVGQSTGTITVPVIGDLIAEPTERFTLALSNPVHGTLGSQSTATGTILDDDGPPEISIDPANYAVAENGGSVAITVTRTNPSIPITVNYATVSGTAIAGSDFTATSGTLSFAAGVISMIINVPIIDASLSSGTRDFTVVLSNPHGGNAFIVAGTGTVTILDNDPPPPAISISGATVTEAIRGLVDAVFTVTLSKASPTPITVQYATADGTAIAGLDYTAVAGTLTFTPGQLIAQVHVPVNTDFVQEDTETFSVVLSNPSSLATLANDSGTGAILNQTVNTVLIDALHPYRYIDSSLHLATIMIKGPGVGTLTYLGLPSNDSKEIVLDGTTAATQFIVRTGPVPTYLVNLTVNGSLASIDGPNLNLQGDLNVTGSLHRLRLNSLVGGNNLTIGAGSGETPNLSVTLDAATDATLTSALPLASLKVINWLDTTPGVDITAPSAALISATGTFQADVTLSGDLGTLKVAKALDGSTIRVGGNINLISAGTISNSLLFAGVDGGVTSLPANTSDFVNPNSTIKRVTVNSSASGAFSGTVIAAPSIGDVQLRSIAIGNNGTPFGVAGTSIHSLKGRGLQAISLTTPELVANPFLQTDLVIRLTV